MSTAISSPVPEKDEVPVITTDSSPSPSEKRLSDAKVNYNVDEEALSTESTALDEAIKIPWAFKSLALLCIVSFPIGTNWTSASLGPLKNTLRNELGITNTQFGVISSADAVVNSIWPIVGGILLDWFGPNIITLLCTTVILVGSILAALGTTLGTWRLLVAGNVVMGFGIAVVDSAQQKFFYHWFGADGLAFAFGLENAIAGTVSLVGGITAIPIRDRTGWYGWCFWIPVFFCAFSVLVSVAYIVFERLVVPENYRFKSGRTASLAASHAQGTDRKRLSWATLFILPWAFWMLPATQLLQSGAAGGFSTSSADIIRYRGYTEAVAGYLSSAQKILPIVLSPIIGAAVDRYGHRFHLVALAPILWIISCALLGFTTVHPTVALVFSSFAGTINAMPLQICIPLLLRDQSKLGTAFGVWRAFNNAGSTIMDISFGVLQDGTENKSYDRVLELAMGLKAWAFVLGIIYILVDWKLLGSGMTLTRRKRLEAEERIKESGTEAVDNLTSREVKKWVTAVGLSLLGAMLITAWVLFFKYLAV
jgi:MFS family permease